MVAVSLVLRTDTVLDVIWGKSLTSRSFLGRASQFYLMVSQLQNVKDQRLRVTENSENVL